MIDTSPEALERLVEALLSEECETTWDLRPDCAYTLRAIAAEKRAAQGGVTDAYRIVCESIVKHQFQDDHRRGRLTVDVETLLHEINARRAVLEALWPGDAPDEYECEAWQDGNLVAGASGGISTPSLATAEEILKAHVAHAQEPSVPDRAKQDSGPPHKLSWIAWQRRAARSGWKRCSLTTR